MARYREITTQEIEMEPWTPDTDMSGVSVIKDTSPKEGDMVANLGEDKWLVTAEFFLKNYELVEA